MQTFAEKLFVRLQRSSGEKMETRMAVITLISRVVGVHRLILLNFYPFLQRYLQPHQRDVTTLLAALIQVSLLPSKLCSTELLVYHSQPHQCRRGRAGQGRAGQPCDIAALHQGMLAVSSWPAVCPAAEAMSCAQCCGETADALGCAAGLP